MLLAYIDSIEPVVASVPAQMYMSQRKLDTFFKLKSDTQQPTPDKEKGDRDKTYLCSTMKNERLSSIGIRVSALHSEHATSLH
jgi:hypothetical protein